MRLSPCVSLGGVSTTKANPWCTLYVLMDWLPDALCRGLSQDFFYPPLDAPSPNHYYTIGKHVCKGCPEWRNCLAEADKNEEVWGLWGGLTPQERKRRATLLHGTFEAKRGGCRCAKCITAPSWEDHQPNLDLIPKSGESYELLPLLFKLSKG